MNLNPFEFVLDLFVPRQNANFSSIHSYLSRAEIDTQIPRLKNLEVGQKQYLNQVLIASEYSSNLIQDLIERAKFYGEIAITYDFAKLLFSKTTEMPKPDLIVPVPFDPGRRVQRGYHIPELIAKDLAKFLKTKVSTILVKTKNTAQQTLLDREERLKNLENKFKINSPEIQNLEKAKTIWIVDDLVTTGTTLLECAKTIKQEYPEIEIYGVVVSGN